MTTDTTRGAPGGRSTMDRVLRATVAAGAAAAGVLVLAACGSSGSPGVANLAAGSTPSASPGGGSGATGQQGAEQFSQCMRSHGIPDFPDPGSGGNVNISAGGDVNPDSPQFQAAQTACRSLLPNGGRPDPSQMAALEASALKFSKCMRAHGVPDFPDPQFPSSGSGGGAVRLQVPQGTDTNSPAFQSARQACQSLLVKPPGATTVQGGGQAAGGGPVTNAGGG